MTTKPLRSFDDLYPGRFLKAGNFQGKKVTLTIKDMSREELEGDDGKKTKAILSFKETELGLVACKTNGLCIKTMFGDDLQNWKGKRVTFFPSEWNGDPCIRVWGSPDIAEDIRFDVKLPRRKPIATTLHKVVASKTDAAQAAPASDTNGAT